MLNIPRFDVLGLGYIAVDDLLYVSEYPPPDAKVRVQRRERQCGGLTGTALVAAARLGARCAYAGVVGDDDLSSFALEGLRREGIDVNQAARRPGARPVHSVVVVDTRHQTRNIFFDVAGVVGADTTWPADNLIASARVLFVDQAGIPGMIRAARLAREQDIPVVADFEGEASPGFPDLLETVDHLIVSQGFAAALTGEWDPARAALGLWQAGREIVVVTCGNQGCWYVSASSQDAQHCPAYAVEAVDTTGCGDVFHGAYAEALARGAGALDRIRFASAAAALKATQPGGQAGVPTRAMVDMLTEEVAQ